MDFARDDVDMGIRYGNGRYPGLHTVWLMEEEVFPVCSPALRSGGHPLSAPSDLAHHTLLHDEGHDGWRTWLLAAGLPEIDPTRGPIFTDSSHLVEAAVEGQGVALARGALAAADLSAGRLTRPFALGLPAVADLYAGRLTRPFALGLPAAFAYYVVCPEATAETPKVKAFTAGSSTRRKRTRPPNVVTGTLALSSSSGRPIHTISCGSSKSYGSEMPARPGPKQARQVEPLLRA